MRHCKYTWLLVATLLGIITSCEKEQFDKEAYNDYVDYEFMIDNMDRSHDWNLTKSDTITIIAPATIKAVQILTGTPYGGNEVEIAAEGVCYGDETTLAYTIPSIQTKLYLAALSPDGKYLGVTPFDFKTKSIDLTTQQLYIGTNLKEPIPQTFTYLYEEDFPLPGDFDYNDIVLRISKDYTESSYQVVLTVKMDAVGAAKQIAGGIHLAGIQYDDVAKVEIISGEQMDKNYPMPRRYISSEEPLMRGRNGEAVVNLFEDAHWVLLKNKNTNGSITRMRVNTSHTEIENQMTTATSVTTTYCITFKTREMARGLTFDRIDPFILEEYNGSVWEVHTYAYKFNDVLKDIFRGNQSAYDNHVSWCVVVPEKDFRYPIEGMSLGTYNSKSGEVFGPYSNFSNWMQNHFAYNDWYKNATRPQLLY